jgi:kexin
MLKKILIGLSLFIAQACWAADTYIPVSNQLAIPSVDVSGILYNNVLITVGNIVSIGGGSPSSTHDSYNPILNQLHIPSVQVGSETYTNVVITVAKVLSIGGASGKDTQPG